MRIALNVLAAFSLLASAGLAGDEASRASDALERPFAGGGRVRMELSAGDYDILAGDDDKILVEWTVRDLGQLRSVEIATDIQGSEARIRSKGPSNHFHVTIRLPARSDLDVRLTAGDLEINGIEGNKSIRSRAGDIKVDMGRVEDLGRVEASLWAGDLHAEPLGVSKGGIFRSFEWDGKGRFDVRVRLLAGDIRLYSHALRD